MAEQKEPLLKLSTLLERDAIEIEGARYELKNPRELPILHYNRIYKDGSRIGDLLQASDPSDDDASTLSYLLERFVAMVVIAPKEALAPLTDIDRLTIFYTFSVLAGKQAVTLPSAILTATAPAPAEQSAEDPAVTPPIGAS